MRTHSTRPTPRDSCSGVLDGKPVASISVVRYGDAFGFLGLYIVQPSWRGKGYGYRLWQAGLAHLAGRNVGLDGVVAQQDNYRKSGFALAYRNIRFAGTGGGAPAIDPRIVDVAGCRSRRCSRTTGPASRRSGPHSCSAGSRNPMRRRSLA